MSTPKEKNILSLWFYPDTIELMRRYKEKEGYKTLSMFAEKAIRFYCGYLSSDEKKAYIPDTINELFESHLGDLDDKISNMIFKNTVELGMLLHVFCALNNVTEENLKELHDAVIKEVKSTYGIVSFKNVLEFQNSQK